MSPNSDDEKIREQNLCEDRHREVSDFIQQIERHLDVLESDFRDLDEGDDEFESAKYEILRMTKELDKAYIEQNELEEKLTKLESPYWDSIDDHSCSTDCES
jgi:hypothetical protein